MPARPLSPVRVIVLVVVALVILPVLIGAATTGVGGFLVVAGLLVGAVGLVALVRGRLRWARIGSRAVAAGVVAGGLVATLTGGLVAPAAPSALTASGLRAHLPATPTSAATAVPTSPAPATSLPSGATTTPRPTRTATPAATTTAPSPRAAAAAPGSALGALAALAVKGRAPRTGYSRAMFGPAWMDVDRNGCDTRNDVLRRDLTRLVLKAGTHGCLVLRGTLADPYTGRTISFVRGVATSTAVQIDHVVALSDAWQKGAQRWSTATREAFANDSLNLLAVDGPTNEGKGDGDAATWLPQNKGYRCAYVARQVAVKKKYSLWVTAAERDAVSRVLTTCPGQPLPVAAAFGLGSGSESSAVAAPPAARPAPAPKAPAPPPGPASSGGTDPDYGTCRNAIAHGAGPYYEGKDPEYAWYRDNDHDGVVCER